MCGKSGPHCKPLTTSITLVRVHILVNTSFMYRALVTCSELLFVSKHPLVLNIQLSLCKIQRLFKDFRMTRTVFKKYKFRKNTDLHVEILVQEC